MNVGMTIFEIFQKYFYKRWDYALVAKDWKEKGGKVIGYPDINCLEELIIAAGCRPLLITGDPNSGTETAQKHMDYATSFPARYLYEAILCGKYDFVDVICTTGGDRWLANMYGFLTAEREFNPSLKFGEIYYIERLRSTFKQHRDYNLARLVAFKEYLEKFTGKKITDESITAAFMITNETRRLLKQVSDLRKTFPPRISGCEALTIIIASMLIPKAKFNELVNHYLEKEVNNLPRQNSSKVRLFVSGSSVDNLQLYELLESLPAIIVGEDTAFGDRYAETPINTEIEPMEALVDRYTFKPLDPWMYGMKERIQYRVNSAIAAKAQGEIFFHYEHDDAVGWDYPDQKRELGKHNIPVLLFEDQKYNLSDTEELKGKAKTFIEYIRGN